MVSNIEIKYRYTAADESELDTLLSGHGVEQSYTPKGFSEISSLRRGSTGVVWARED